MQGEIETVYTIRSSFCQHFNLKVSKRLLALESSFSMCLDSVMRPCHGNSLLISSPLLSSNSWPPTSFVRSARCPWPLPLSIHPHPVDPVEGPAGGPALLALPSQTASASASAARLCLPSSAPPRPRPSFVRSRLLVPAQPKLKAEGPTDSFLARNEACCLA